MSFSVSVNDVAGTKNVEVEIVEGQSVTLTLSLPTFEQQMAYNARFVSYHYVSNPSEEMASHMIRDLDLVKGWDGLLDSDGTPIPFSTKNLRKIMSISGDFALAVRKAVQDIYPTTTPKPKESETV